MGLKVSVLDCGWSNLAVFYYEKHQLIKSWFCCILSLSFKHQTQFLQQTRCKNWTLLCPVFFLIGLHHYNSQKWLTHKFLLQVYCINQLTVTNNKSSRYLCYHDITLNTDWVFFVFLCTEGKEPFRERVLWLQGVELSYMTLQIYYRDNWYNFIFEQKERCLKYFRQKIIWRSTV